MSQSAKQRIKELTRMAERAGWRVVMTKRHHLKWYPPRGDMYVSPTTPSDYRSIKNIEAELKRRGLEA